MDSRPVSSHERAVFLSANETFPLAFGQLGVYRSIVRRSDLSLHSSLPNLTTLVVTDCVSPREAQERLTSLEVRHEALRVRIDFEASPEPLQMVLNPRAAEFPVMNSSLEDWRSIQSKFEELDHFQGYLWHAVIIHDVETRRVGVGLVVSHLIADAWALNILRRELSNGVGLSSTRAPSLRTAVTSERARWYAGSVAADRSLERWVAALASLTEATPSIGQETRVHRVQETWSAELSALLSARGVGLTSLALDGYASNFLRDGEEQLICLVASNRIRKVDRELVCSLIQPVPLILRRSSRSSADAISELNREVISALAVSRFHPDVVEDHLDGGVSSTGDGFPMVLNVHNAPSFLARPESRPPVDERWTEAKPRGFVNYLQVAIDFDSLSVQWQSSDSLGTVPRADRICSHVKESLR